MDERARDGLNHVDFGAVQAQEGAARLDVQRSRVALTYAAALAHGVTDPTTLHKVYTITRPGADLNAGLIVALRAGQVGAWLAGLAPQDADYRKLSAAYLRYRKASPEASTPTISDGSSSIHVGDHDPRVDAIVGQLVSEGYLPADAAQQTGNGSHTKPVAEAVAHLPTAYGIKSGGTVGGDTLEIFNQGPNDMARALAVVMERRRWLSRTPSTTRLHVNTAAATLSYYRDGKLVERREVIAGNPRRKRHRPPHRSTGWWQSRPGRCRNRYTFRQASTKPKPKDIDLGP